MSSAATVIPFGDKPGLTVIRKGEVVYNSAFEESAAGRLKNFEVWNDAVLEAARVFASVGIEERELQLAALNTAVEKINEALGFLVEAKFREEPDGS